MLDNISSCFPSKTVHQAYIPVGRKSAGSAAGNNSYSLTSANQQDTNMKRLEHKAEMRGTGFARSYKGITLTKELKNMKRTLLAIMAVAVLGITKVGALTVTVDYVNGYHEGSGGEFNVSPITGVGYAPVVMYNNNSGNLGFGTFCIDRDTPISVPGQYNAVINEGGTTSSGNQIAVGTAWLFQKFAQGTLGGYNYLTLGDPGRAKSAMDLQLAIWVLEGSYSYSDPTVNSFLNLIIAEYGSIANATQDNNNQVPVGVLLLTDLRNGQNAQPLLTLVPDGGSALILLGMALSSMAVIARKFRN